MEGIHMGIGLGLIKCGLVFKGSAVTGIKVCRDGEYSI